MKLILIAAIARNRVIGKNGRLPWHIPEDLTRFKQRTTGGIVIMGRRTFDSFGGRPLPSRTNIVITSHVINGVKSYPSLEFALQALQNEKEVFVIGGAKVFADALPCADELLITLVEKDAEGDTYFPPYLEYVRNHFFLTLEERHSGFTFLDYRRKK